MDHLFHDRPAQLEILAHGTREQIIKWLKWNDPNGVWTDSDSVAEGKPRMTLVEARQWMHRAILDEYPLTDA